MSRIAIMGSGAWGTALAISLARRGGHQITLWSYAKDVAAAMRDRRENTQFLPGFRIPESVAVFEDAAGALDGAEIVVSVTPSQFVRSTYEGFAAHLRPGQLLVSATKGIEDETYLRMTQVIGEVLGSRGLELPCGVLSGPSFAQEVAAGAPTAITIASADPNLASTVQREFSSSTLRLYTNDDVVGVELGGSLKNVIAIAAGIVAGLELGYNSTAALITRGIAEITRLSIACGGRRETLAGLSGHGRPGADLHRIAVAEPDSRHGPWTGQKDRRDSGRTRRPSRGGRQDYLGGARPGAPARCGNAHCRADGSHSAAWQGATRRH